MSVLKGKKILITAGPTHEPIDPVRYIGNHSSGKMGYALANVAIKRGAEVLLISGPTNLEAPSGATLMNVQSANDMFEAVKNAASDSDVVIFAAAVADYTPRDVSKIKIKKQESSFAIELVKTVDIAETMGRVKRKNQVHIGFALETNNEVDNAKKKLKRKNLDFIVLNSLKNPGTCFGSENNQIIILEENKKHEFELKSKEDVAIDIFNHLENKLHESSI